MRGTGRPTATELRKLGRTFAFGVLAVAIVFALSVLLPVPDLVQFLVVATVVSIVADQGMPLLSRWMSPLPRKSAGDTGALGEDRPMIIGLSGRKRSGKDSLAEFLVREHGFARVAFADPLKDVLLHLNPDVIGLNRQHASLQGLYEIFGGWEGLKAAPNWAPAIRRLQQDIGVGVREHVDADTWLNAALARVQQFRDAGVPVVVTDMRFPNEVDGIRALGGLIVRVERDSIPAESLADTHVSEALLDDMDLLRPDLVLNSDPFDTFGERFVAATAGL